MDTESPLSSLPKPLNFLELHRSTFKAELLALFSFLIVLILIRFESITLISSHYLGGYSGDVSLYIYLLRELASQFPSVSFETNSFFPYGYSLAWSDNFILPAFVGTLLLKIGLPLVVSYNLLILGANFLNGYLTYRLAFRLTGSFVPSIFAGSAFMASSYFTWNLGHPQLQFSFFIPLSLSFLFSAIATRRALFTFLCALTITASFLSAVYIAVFLSIAVLFLFIGVMLLRPERFNLKEIGSLAVGGVVGLLPLLYFAAPYFKAREYFGGRYLYEAFAFSANILSYFSLPPLHSFLSFSSNWSNSEAHLFPGLLLCAGACLAIKRVCEAKKLRANGLATLGCFLGLALLTLLLGQRYQLYFAWFHLVAAVLSFATVILALRQLYLLGKIETKLGLYILSNRGIIAIFLLLSLIFTLFSFGPLGDPEKHQVALGFHRLMFEIFPGVSSIRAISRAGIIVLFCLSILSAFALAHIIERSSFKGFVFAPLIALTLIENLISTYPLEPALATPPVLNSLMATPNNDAIIGLPFSGELASTGQVQSWSKFAKIQGNFMQWFLETGHPSVNGYSGQRSWVINNFPRLLSNFPDKSSISTLLSIAGLRYVLFCSSFSENFKRERFLKDVAALESDLSLLAEDQSGNFLFEITGAVKVTKKTYLLAPNSRQEQGDLILSLMSPYEATPREVEVELKLDGSETVFSQLKIQTDGIWSQFQLPLPKLEPGVAPIKIGFQIHTSDTIDAPSLFLKGTRVTVSNSNSIE